MPEIQDRLHALADPFYKQFQSKLIPTVDPDTVIGIRIPLLRKFAKSQFSDFSDFLKALPHKYYEENNLHGILISEMSDDDDAIAALDIFLPYVNNWATCDLIAPKSFSTHPAALLLKVSEWISSNHTYTVRFGIGVLMRYYLDPCFSPEYLAMVASVHSEEYYIKMMIAWFFATALAKQYDYALPFIQNRCLDPWCHNKTIQKAVESYRISKEKKAFLRTLKIK